MEKIESAEAKAKWVRLLHSEKGWELVMAYSHCKPLERENILKKIQELDE